MFSTTPVAGMLAVVLPCIGYDPGALLDAVFHVPDNLWLLILKFSLLGLCLGGIVGVGFFSSFASGISPACETTRT